MPNTKRWIQKLILLSNAKVAKDIGQPLICFHYRFIMLCVCKETKPVMCQGEITTKSWLLLVSGDIITNIGLGKLSGNHCGI